MTDDIYSVLENFKDINSGFLKEGFKAINERYRSINSDVFRIKSKEEALAYSFYRLPATSAVIDEVLIQAELVGLPSDEIKSILDIGAGPASSAISLYNHFENIESVSLLEREESMIKMGEQLLTLFSKEGLIDKNVFSYKNSDISDFNNKEKFDLILCSYMLNEIPEEEIESFSKKLADIDFKYAVFITPGTPKFFRKLNTLRDCLLEDKNSTIIAPCPFTGKCIIKNDDWCHFSKRISRNKTLKQIKEADLSYEDEKFSYLVLRKNNENESLIEKALDNKTLDNKNSDSYLRVLRHPIIRKGLVEINFCSKEGIQKKIFTKGKNKEEYKEIKNLKWGSHYKTKL